MIVKKEDIMGFDFNLSISAAVVFFQGILSFFSPCVLPLVPLYISYLSGGAAKKDENGEIHYPRKTILINTLFFVLGISFVFIVLGLGFQTLGRFFNQYGDLFSKISAVIMVLFGIYQLGIFKKSGAIETEKRFSFDLDRFAMGPWLSFLLGFTFSFAWTPCVGPTLSSVLLMAGSSESSVKGFLLILVYTLGFAIPFLATGLFTGSVLSFFKKHGNIMKYTVKVGAVLLILMGIMTFTGYMDTLSGKLSMLPSSCTTQENEAIIDEETKTPEPEPTEDNRYKLPEFSLADQNGNTHTLADYEGRIIFLNFWATWCGPCKSELPEINELYHEYKDSDEVAVISIVSPNSGREGDIEYILDFIEENNIDFPVLMDEGGEYIGYQIGIRAYPTTFMIDKEGYLKGYVEGVLNKEMMEQMIEQTLEK